MALILANDGIDASAKQALIDLGHVVDTAKYEGDALLARLAEVDAVIVRSATKIRNPEIDAGAAGNLKLIIRGGVGVDNINVDYAEEKGIEVRNTPAASSSAVAELALGHMLSLARHIGEANVTMREGKWLKKAVLGHGDRRQDARTDRIRSHREVVGIQMPRARHGCDFPRLSPA